MSEPLTPATLDAYAKQYYLDLSGSDLFIEEVLQCDVVALIEPLLGPDLRVLEMGYGTGVVARELIRRGQLFDVVEGSPLLCDVARATVPELDITCSLFEDFVAPEYFDVVLCLFILEHVDDPARVVRNATEWLKPGGRLVVAVPNALSVHRQAALSMGLQDSLDALSERDLLVGHQRVFTPDQLLELLRNEGLRDVELTGSFLKVVPNAMMTDWPPALIESLCVVGRELPPECAANIVAVGSFPA